MAGPPLLHCESLFLCADELRSFQMSVIKLIRSGKAASPLKLVRYLL
jgi:hypothetical protein